MEKNTFEKDVIARLDILISLLLERGGEDVSMSAKISKLSSMGLSASQIAHIVGKPSNYVSATLSNIKAKSKQSKGG